MTDTPRGRRRVLRAFLRAERQTDELDGSALADLARAVIAVVVVSVNLIGTTVVLALTLVVIPLPRDHMLPWPAYVLAACLYLLLAVPIGAYVGLRQHRGVLAWLSGSGPADEQTRFRVLTMPLRLFWLQLSLWTGGAVIFGGFELGRDAERGLWVVVIVVLSGAVTATCAYLLIERLARPLATRSLAAVDPLDLRVGRGIALRGILAWALGSGIPLVGLLVLGVRTLVPAEVTRHELSVAAVVLAGTGLVVGLLTVVVAARATADPVVGMARAMAEVRAGHFEVRVPVYDGSEVGRLQAGFNEMVSGLEERERIRATFGAYVDPDVAEHILREGTDLAGEEVEVSMMFLDIRDFTGFAERTPASGVVGTINRLFERAVPLIRDHGGHVNKFVGDGLLAVFGAPQRLPDHADRAVRAAVEIAAAVDDEFGGSLAVGIGVNTGVVVAGNVGGAGRFEFSVIGDPVNVAARIEAATRRTGDTVLISQRTRELLTASADSEGDASAGADSTAGSGVDAGTRGGVDRGLVERPDIVLKGKSAPVSLYGVV